MLALDEKDGPEFPSYLERKAIEKKYVDRYLNVRAGARYAREQMLNRTSEMVRNVIGRLGDIEKQMLEMIGEFSRLPSKPGADASVRIRLKMVDETVDVPKVYGSLRCSLITRDKSGRRKEKALGPGTDWRRILAKQFCDDELQKAFEIRSDLKLMETARQTIQSIFLKMTRIMLSDAFRRDSGAAIGGYWIPKKRKDRKSYQRDFISFTVLWMEMVIQGLTERDAKIDKFMLKFNTVYKRRNYVLSYTWRVSKFSERSFLWIRPDLQIVKYAKDKRGNQARYADGHKKLTWKLIRLCHMGRFHWPLFKYNKKIQKAWAISRGVLVLMAAIKRDAKTAIQTHEALKEQLHQRLCDRGPF